MIRAVVDINVILSALIIARGIPYSILSAWQAGHFELISSAGILHELEEKLHAPKISRYGIGPGEIAAILSLLRTQATLIAVSAQEQRVVTGDPEDDLVLATARLARANYLVTGDRKLLALTAYGEIAIIRPREFVQLLTLEGQS